MTKWLFCSIFFLPSFTISDFHVWFPKYARHKAIPMETQSFHGELHVLLVPQKHYSQTPTIHNWLSTQQLTKPFRRGKIYKKLNAVHRLSETDKQAPLKKLPAWNKYRKPKHPAKWFAHINLGDHPIICISQ